MLDGPRANNGAAEDRHFRAKKCGVILGETRKPVPLAHHLLKKSFGLKGI